jgi:hypothetical protein
MVQRIEAMVRMRYQTDSTVMVRSPHSSPRAEGVVRIDPALPDCDLFHSAVIRLNCLSSADLTSAGLKSVRRPSFKNGIRP